MWNQTKKQIPQLMKWLQNKCQQFKLLITIWLRDQQSAKQNDSPKSKALKWKYTSGQTKATQRKGDLRFKIRDLWFAIYDFSLDEEMSSLKTIRNCITIYLIDILIFIFFFWIKLISENT